MASINKILHRLAIKRRFEQIIADEWKLELVDYFKTSVDPSPQVWITDINETFTTIGSIQSNKLNAQTSITIVVFSEREETKVHEIISDLMDLTPLDFPGLSIDDIVPNSSSTNYQNDASEGHVMAAITLDLKYLYTRGK